MVVEVDLKNLIGLASKVAMVAMVAMAGLGRIASRSRPFKTFVGKL